MPIRLVFVCAAAACRRRYTAVEVARRLRHRAEDAAECLCGSVRFFVFVEEFPTPT